MNGKHWLFAAQNVLNCDDILQYKNSMCNHTQLELIMHDFRPEKNETSEFKFTLCSYHDGGEWDVEMKPFIEPGFKCLFLL